MQTKWRIIGLAALLAYGCGNPVHGSGDADTQASPEHEADAGEGEPAAGEGAPAAGGGGDAGEGELDADAAAPQPSGEDAAVASRDAAQEPLDAGAGLEDASAAADAAGPACSATQTACVSTCADLRVDPYHCGACDHACATGEVCEAGGCTRPFGLTQRVPAVSCALGATPPALVSQTGCYANVAARIPAAGLIPYAVNASLWADGTEKRRFVVLPGTATIGYRATSAWDFPEGTLLIKEFLLATRRGDASSLRPLETRFLVRRADGWQGYTYRWNDALDDAELYNGGEISYPVMETDGSTSTYTHFYPGKNDCRRCHNDTAGGTLGMRSVQMNRSFNYGGVVDNQLRAFDHIGLFGGTLPKDSASWPSMPDPLDTAAPLAARARAYLEGNCAHCHHPGGPSHRSMDLRYQVSFADTHTCNVDPEVGDLGVQNAKIIAPMHHELSVLWLRMSARDNHAMPPLGSLLVDPDGSALLRDFIDGLSSCP